MDTISEAQRLQLDLMRLASFNAFDGNPSDSLGR